MLSWYQALGSGWQMFAGTVQRYLLCHKSVRLLAWNILGRVKSLSFGKLSLVWCFSNNQEKDRGTTCPQPHRPVTSAWYLETRFGKICSFSLRFYLEELSLTKHYTTCFAKLDQKYSNKFYLKTRFQGLLILNLQWRHYLQNTARKIANHPLVYYHLSILTDGYLLTIEKPNTDLLKGDFVLKAH